MWFGQTEEHGTFRYMMLDGNMELL